MTRFVVLLVLLAVLVTGSSVLGQQSSPDFCERGEYLFDRLPLLPEGRYPVRGFFLWDAYLGSPGPAELVFTADPDRDGCFSRFRAAPKVAFTDHGGEHVEVKVWWVEDTMHIYLPSDQTVWDWQ